ncbi:MAG: hypothetical protein JWQ07_1420 [Ramlibacter sp.]|nr:hypothetical protein [Ramlibacter sp.]
MFTRNRSGMSSVYDTLYQWARKTTTSFADLRLVTSERNDRQNGGQGLIYRLKRWPDLPRHSRTADVFRTLSVMSHRPVNRRWILANSKLQAGQVDRLLKRLVDEDAVEVIDSASFPAAENPAS